MHETLVVPQVKHSKYSTFSSAVVPKRWTTTMGSALARTVAGSWAPVGVRRRARRLSAAVLALLGGQAPGAATTTPRRADEPETAAAVRYEALRRHPELFGGDWLSAGYVDPELVALAADAKAGDAAAVRAGLEEVAPGIYSLPFFTSRLCDHLLDELDGYRASGLPIRRPNSMNNYGIIVNEIGLRPAINALQDRYIQPIASLLYPAEASVMDGHHSFMVQYRPDEDLGLDQHTDDSDVTVNVNLGREFEGAGLTFCGISGTPSHRHVSVTYQHVKGRAVMHLGAQRHGADEISKGERNNLIIWNWNSAYRAAGGNRARGFVPEDGEPDPQCLSWTHDRDYAAYKPLPSTAALRTNAERAWCPPRQACYDGMADVVAEAKRRLQDQALRDHKAQQQQQQDL